MPTDPSTYKVTLSPLQALLLTSLLRLPALPLALNEPQAEPDERAVLAAVDDLVARGYATRPDEDILSVSSTVVSILQRIAAAPVMMSASAFRDWSGHEARFHIAHDLLVMEEKQDEQIMLSALRDGDVLGQALLDLAPLPEEEPATSDLDLGEADIQAAFGLVSDPTPKEASPADDASAPRVQLDDRMAVARLDVYRRDPGERWSLVERLAWLTCQEMLWRANEGGSGPRLYLSPSTKEEIRDSWRALVGRAVQHYAPYQAPTLEEVNHA